MAYVISDECVACGTCASECPADAISEGDGKYVIDADACLECGTCEAACPTGAISAESFKCKRIAESVRKAVGSMQPDCFFICKITALPLSKAFL